MHRVGSLGLALTLLLSSTAGARQGPGPRQGQDARGNAMAADEKRVARLQARLAAGRRLQFAGDDHFITFESEEPAPPPDEEEEGPPPAIAPGMFNFRAAVLDRENFDRWLFGDDKTEESRLTHLRIVLKSELASVARARPLTAAQGAKLELAARGDIKRFFDRVDVERREFEQARKEYGTGRVALNKLKLLSAEFQAGPFGTSSLFAKTLKKIEADR